MSSIENVSDTALWVASYRALESARPDALFHDPWAEMLAGERGRAIARAMGYASIMAWIMTVRTVAIDRLIESAIAQGIDTVLSLGAGLDTRPYRMKLPAELRWIEADHPRMIEYKEAKMAGIKPMCRLEHVTVDLAVADDRQRLLARVGGEAKRAVVLTEGVIPYLSNEEARALARDLRQAPHLDLWIQDFHPSGRRRAGIRRWNRKLKSAPFRFQVPDWFAFFAEEGWQARGTIFMTEEGKRIGRPLPFVFPWSIVFRIMPARVREKASKMSGYVMMAKR